MRLPHSRSRREDHRRVSTSNSHADGKALLGPSSPAAGARLEWPVVSLCNGVLVLLFRQSRVVWRGAVAVCLHHSPLLKNRFGMFGQLITLFKASRVNRCSI